MEEAGEPILTGTVSCRQASQVAGAQCCGIRSAILEAGCVGIQLVANGGRHLGGGRLDRAARGQQVDRRQQCVAFDRTV